MGGDWAKPAEKNRAGPADERRPPARKDKNITCGSRGRNQELPPEAVLQQWEGTTERLGLPARCQARKPTKKTQSVDGRMALATWLKGKELGHERECKTRNLGTSTLTGRKRKKRRTKKGCALLSPESGGMEKVTTEKCGAETDRGRES